MGANFQFPSGALMVDSFQIKNFRSFDDVDCKNCSLINVIVGDNGSGKTALLEGLFLAAGVSPELILRTRAWRGFEPGQMSGTPEDVHVALWGDLFHNFETSQPALISLRGGVEHTRSVTIKLTRVGQRRIIPPSRTRPGTPVRIEPVEDPISFKWKIGGLPDVTVLPSFVDGRLHIPPVASAYVRGSFFAANRTPSVGEMANQFSSLSQAFKEREFVDLFSRLYPNVEDLSLEIGAGAPMIFATVKNVTRKLPLGLASGGMTKLASMLLAMMQHPGGILFADEIENGFYFDRIPMVWGAIREYAKKYNCQVFASTHSSECLFAAAALAEKYPSEFSMIRTVLDAGKTKLHRFGGDRFSNAVMSRIEVR